MTKDCDSTAKQSAPTPIKRNHHIVPRFYLSSFAERGQLAEWNPATNEVRHLSPRKAAVIADYYLVVDENGEPSDFIETEILERQVETPGARALRRLQVVFPPDSVDRKRVALFVAAQETRGQRANFRLAHPMAEIGQMLLGMAKDLIDRGVTVQGLEDLKPGDLGGTYAVEVARPAVVIPTMDQVNLKAPLLEEAPWTLYRFRAPLLVTSDEPVWVWSEDMTTRNEVEDLMGSPNSKWIALTPLHALRIGGGPPHEELIEAPLDLAEILNRHVVGSCYELVYGPPSVIDQLAKSGS